MRKGIIAAALISVFASGGFALGEARLRSGTDLDTLSDAQLRKDLLAELDDIDFDPDEQYPLAELHDAIFEALSDDGDDEGDDASEEEIDLSDLEAEMEEAHLTLEGAVHEALARADELAARHESAPQILLAVNSADVRFQYGYYVPVAQRRNARRGFTTTRVAIQQTTNTLVAGIRRAR